MLLLRILFQCIENYWIPSCLRLLLIYHEERWQMSLKSSRGNLQYIRAGLERQELTCPDQTIHRHLSMTHLTFLLLKIASVTRMEKTVLDTKALHSSSRCKMLPGERSQWPGSPLFLYCTLWYTLRIFPLFFLLPPHNLLSIQRNTCLFEFNVLLYSTYSTTRSTDIYFKKFNPSHRLK